MRNANDRQKSALLFQLESLEFANETFIWNDRDE